MRALPAGSAPAADALDPEAPALSPLAPGMLRGRRVSALTPALLADLAEVSRTHLGADPLAAEDTPVGLLEGDGYVCQTSLDSGAIYLTEGFLGALEFAAAQAAMVNLLGRIRRRVAEGAPDPHGLAPIIAETQTALHSAYVTRLVLHMVGEEPAPRIARFLPAAHKRFVHWQTALSTVFALLHEQAHLAFAAGAPWPGGVGAGHGALFAPGAATQRQREEHACDLWAIDRLGDITAQRRLLRAAAFLFFNAWQWDYLRATLDGAHPNAFNRIQVLMRARPVLAESDATFHAIMTGGLNEQRELRAAMTGRDRPARYAALMRYARAGGQFAGYEAMVDAICRAAEEMGAAGLDAPAGDAATPGAQAGAQAGARAAP